MNVTAEEVESGREPRCVLAPFSAAFGTREPGRLVEVPPGGDIEGEKPWLMIAKANERRSLDPAEVVG